MTSANTTKAAMTDDHILKARQETTVTPSTVHDNVVFAAFTFSVEKYSLKMFRAMVDGKEYLNGKSNIALVADIVNDVNGSPLKVSKGHFVVTYKDWVEVSNEPDISLTDEQEARLAELATMILEGSAAESVSKTERRAAVFSQGESLSEARGLLERYDADGAIVKASSQNWGKWQTINLPMVLRGKNAVSEHMGAAALSELVRGVIPASKGSAKAIVTWRDASLKALFAAAVESAMSDLPQGHAPKVLAAGYDATVADAKLAKPMKTALTASFEKLAADHNDVWVDATPELDDLNIPKPESVKAIEAGLSMTVFAADMAIGDLLSAKGLAKALKTVLDAPKPATPKDKADDAAAAYSDDDNEVGKTFVTFTPEEAAQHLATIAFSRDDAIAILEDAIDMVETMQKARDEKLAANEAAAAEKADAESQAAAD